MTPSKSMNRSGLSDFLDEDEEPLACLGTFHKANPIFPSLQELKEAELCQYDVKADYNSTGWPQSIARSPYFEKFALGVIVIQVVWIAIDTDFNTSVVLSDAHVAFQIAEYSFCAFFSLELLIRLLALETKRNCLNDVWFLFDACLAFFMIVDTILLNILVAEEVGVQSLLFLKFVRLVPLFQLGRIVRICRAMPELTNLIKGMVAAMRSIGLTLLLLVGIIYFFALLFTKIADGSKVGDVHFRRVDLSMYTLLLRGTYMDEIAAITDEIKEESLFLCLLFLLFVLLTAWVTVHMIIAVLCEAVSVSAESERWGSCLRSIQSRAHFAIKELDVDTDRISRQDFDDLLRNHVFIQALKEVGVCAEEVLEMLDLIWDSATAEDTSCISFNRCVDLALQLRGTNVATVNDLIGQRKHLSKIEDKLCRRLDDMERNIGKAEHVEVVAARPTVRKPAIQDSIAKQPFHCMAADCEEIQETPQYKSTEDGKSLLSRAAAAYDREVMELHKEIQTMTGQLSAAGLPRKAKKQKISTRTKGIARTTASGHINADAYSDSKLRENIRRCELNNDGSINKIELVKVLRKDPEIAALLEPPSSKVRSQDDGSRAAVEAVEQLLHRIDLDGDGNLSLSEVRGDLRSSDEGKNGAAAQAHAQASASASVPVDSNLSRSRVEFRDDCFSRDAGKTGAATHADAQAPAGASMPIPSCWLAGLSNKQALSVTGPSGLQLTSGTTSEELTISPVNLSSDGQVSRDGHAPTSLAGAHGDISLDSGGKANFSAKEIVDSSGQRQADAGIFSVGNEVMIFGLKNKKYAYLNGQKGIVKAWVPQYKSWQVQMDNGCAILKSTKIKLLDISEMGTSTAKVVVEDRGTHMGEPVEGWDGCEYDKQHVKPEDYQMAHEGGTGAPHVDASVRSDLLYQIALATHSAAAAGLDPSAFGATVTSPIWTSSGAVPDNFEFPATTQASQAVAPSQLEAARAAGATARQPELEPSAPNTPALWLQEFPHSPSSLGEIF